MDPKESPPSENAEPSLPSTTPNPQPAAQNSAAPLPQKAQDPKQDDAVKNGGGETADAETAVPMDTSEPTKNYDSASNLASNAGGTAEASPTPNEEAKTDVKQPEEASSPEDADKMQDDAKEPPAAPTATPDASAAPAKPPPASENAQQNTQPAAPVSQPIDAAKNNSAAPAPSLPQAAAKPVPVSSPLIVQGPGYLAHQTGAQATANTTAQPVASVNLTPSSAPIRPEYMQAFQQAQLSQNAAIAANQRAANARAGIVMNGITPVRQTNQLHNATAGVYNRANAMAGNATHHMYARGAAQIAAQNQKRSYQNTPIRYVQNNARTASAIAAAAASSTPTQKYIRTPNGRAPANNYKNHLHAQDAATRFKAAYNNAGPALVNIVENAAAYFEGKDTPEAVKDKERSFERYLFNADLLSEIFDGPLPELSGESDEGKAKSADPKKTPAQVALERVLKVNLLEGIGGRMMNRSLEERVSELDALKERFTRMENTHRKAEKGCMRLFQKVDRASSIDELRRVRAEYEKEMGVTFVEHPPLFEKRTLDRSMSSISTQASEAIIIKLP